MNASDRGDWSALFARADALDETADVDAEDIEETPEVDAEDVRDALGACRNER